MKKWRYKKELTVLSKVNLHVDIRQSDNASFALSFFGHEFLDFFYHLQHVTLILASCLQQYSARGAGLYKTHLPYSLVPGLSEDSPAKYIYVYRNPKDAAVSYYHHTQAMVGPIPWDEYVESYMIGGGYIHLGPIFENLSEWCKHKGTRELLTYNYMRTQMP